MPRIAPLVVLVLAGCGGGAESETTPEPTASAETLAGHEVPAVPEAWRTSEHFSLVWDAATSALALPDAPAEHDPVEWGLSYRARLLPHGDKVDAVVDALRAFDDTDAHARIGANALAGMALFEWASFLAELEFPEGLGDDAATVRAGVTASALEYTGPGTLVLAACADDAGRHQLDGWADFCLGYLDRVRSLDEGLKARRRSELGELRGATGVAAR